MGKVSKRYNLIQRLHMPLPELQEYYRQLRAERINSGLPLKGIRFRKRIHPILVSLVKLLRCLNRQKLTILKDCRKPTRRPVIYALTHVGRYDVEMSVEIIHDACYFLFGDPGPIYKELGGLLIWLHGAIFVDIAYKEDRNVGKETSIELLGQGGNLLIFPEGAWNIIGNQVVMPLFTGTIEIAMRTGAEIIPIAMERYGKHYYANIGENINLSGHDLSEKASLTDQLRDVLCTLKWEIFEHIPPIERKDLPEGMEQRFVEDILSEAEESYGLEDILRSRYHPRATAPEEAFAYMDDLIPCRENAFLLRDRCSA